MMTRWLTPLLLILLAGCGTASRLVRLDTGREKPTIFTPRTGDAQPVQLDVDDFEEAVTELAQGIWPSSRPQEAARRLFEVEARSGSYTYEPTAAASLRSVRASTWRGRHRRRNWS